MSRGGPVEVGKDLRVDVLPMRVTVFGGVVALGLQGVAEGDGGGEEATGLADRLVATAELWNVPG